MLTKKCYECWKDIPLPASTCPYCRTKQRQATKGELRRGSIVCLIISIASFIASLFFYIYPPKTLIARNPSYAESIFLAISGVAFLILSAAMHWDSKR